jgi:hypothetical protein
MKAGLRILGVALGYSTLAFIWVPGPLNRDAFYWSGKPVSLFLPSILDFVLLWFAMAVLLLCIRRQSWARRFVWSILLAFAPVLALEAYALLPGTYIPAKVRLVVGLVCLGAWILLRTVFAGRFARNDEAIIAAASVVLLFLSLNGVYVIVHGTVLGWRMRHENDVPARSVHLRPALPGRPRVIWIMMDELSYKLVYEHRPAGLSLPNFDALAAQSTLLPNITSASGMTELSMPDYMTGIAIDRDFYLPNGQLEMRRLDNRQHIAFDQYNTIFEDAHRYGYNTGIAGWFIPYCRLLRDVVDRCSWESNEPNRNGTIAGASLAANILAPARRIVGLLVPEGFRPSWLPLKSNSVVEREQHIVDYDRIVAASDALLLNRDMDFVLLHLPVPHMPGIYDLRTGDLSADSPSGYVANLALADRCLAHLRSTLEASGQWDTSTVLVMGDHGWRLEMGFPPDHVAAAGGADLRPVYIVKFAGQRQPVTITQPYHAIRTRSLLQAILQQKVRTPKDLTTWVRQLP